MKKDIKELNEKFLDAVRNGDREAAEKLLSEGAQIDARLATGYSDFDSDRLETCLMIAARECNLDMVKFLLKKGANANLKDCNRLNEHTVIDYALDVPSGKDNEVDEIVRIFLECGVVVDKESGERYFGTAIKNRWLKVVKTLDEICGVNIDGKVTEKLQSGMPLCETFLHEAMVSNGKAMVLDGICPAWDIVGYLLERGADVNKKSEINHRDRDKMDVSPLRIALYNYAPTEIIEKMIQNGADIYEKWEESVGYGRGALGYALWMKMEDAVAAILGTTEDVDIVKLLKNNGLVSKEDKPRFDKLRGMLEKLDRKNGLANKLAAGQAHEMSSIEKCLMVMLLVDACIEKIENENVGELKKIVRDYTGMKEATNGGTPCTHDEAIAEMQYFAFVLASEICEKPHLPAHYAKECEADRRASEKILEELSGSGHEEARKIIEDAFQSALLENPRAEAAMGYLFKTFGGAAKAVAKDILEEVLGRILEGMERETGGKDDWSEDEDDMMPCI